MGSCRVSEGQRRAGIGFHLTAPAVSSATRWLVTLPLRERFAGRLRPDLWENNPTPEGEELDLDAKGGATLDGRLWREVPPLHPNGVRGGGGPKKKGENPGGGVFLWPRRRGGGVLFFVDVGCAHLTPARFPFAVLSHP